MLSACKSRILEFVWFVKPMGTRLAALKFLQRVILVQTRGISDPSCRTGMALIFCSFPSSWRGLSDFEPVRIFGRESCLYSS
ncbi:hypothetical protein C8J56DRAFT_953626 [Mycena floridula]|nr:hypothetical protein C8J56DRAFT_953626 [Mycena floridula]